MQLQTLFGDYKCQKKRKKKISELRFINAVKDFIPKYENEVEKDITQLHKKTTYREWKKDKLIAVLMKKQ